MAFLARLPYDHHRMHSWPPSIHVSPRSPSRKPNKKQIVNPLPDIDEDPFSHFLTPVDEDEDPFSFSFSAGIIPDDRQSGSFYARIIGKVTRHANRHHGTPEKSSPYQVSVRSPEDAAPSYKTEIHEPSWITEAKEEGPKKKMRPPGPKRRRHTWKEPSRKLWTVDEEEEGKEGVDGVVEEAPNPAVKTQ
ncbi:MAG: hypothetical protein M1820_002973 [Bogoriella megaspora]|nr:MAG: hypothetical protein M1820_002973 [Bogoriella megaspora]